MCMLPSQLPSTHVLPANNVVHLLSDLDDITDDSHHLLACDEIWVDGDDERGHNFSPYKREVTCAKCLTSPHGLGDNWVTRKYSPRQELWHNKGGE